MRAVLDIVRNGKTYVGVYFYDATRALPQFITRTDEDGTIKVYRCVDHMTMGDVPHGLSPLNYWEYELVPSLNVGPITKAELKSLQLLS